MAFRLSDKRCEEIKEIVVNTFEELNIRCIPISAFEMATKLGAVVVPSALGSAITNVMLGAGKKPSLFSDVFAL